MQASDAAALAQQLQVAPELLIWFLDTNGSFITTASDALLQLATRTAHIEGSELRFESLMIAVSRDGLFTAESADSGLGKAVRARWTDDATAQPSGPWSLLAMVLDEFADSYLPVMESVEDQALAMEQYLIAAPLTPEQLTVLFRMRRQLILLQRIIDPLTRLVARLAQTDGLSAGARGPENAKDIDFRAARDGMQRLASRVDGAGRVVTSVVEMSNLFEQQRLGSASRKLASWAAIVAVPAALAGIFGMNFDDMAILKTPHGHWIALGMMGAAALCLFVRFRRIGWL